MDFTEVKILSSPFLKCLQSASKISCEFENQPIDIDYILSERLDTIEAEVEDPIDVLALRSQNKAELIKDGLNGIDFVDEGKNFEEIRKACI